VHVDLSVLVWFLSFGGALWTMNGTLRYQPLAWLAFAAAVTGTAAMCVAPFVERAAPVMANYVPVLDGPVFLTGLVLFGAGIALLCLRSMLAAAPVGIRISGGGALRFGLNAALVATAVAACAFAWSWHVLPRTLDPRIYYELLFWGGGHVLQFMHTLLMLVALGTLLEASGSRLRGSPRLQLTLYALCALPLLAVPWLYRFPVDSREHILGFTALMRYGGAACIPMLLLIAASLGREQPPAPVARPLRAALICALALFAGGGVMGFMIQGSNTVIPAHYHGSIVGVTVAYMGVVYLLLPALGRPITLPQLAAWQPYVYGIGQVLHVTALAWTGGHGVKRKTAGAAQGLDSVQEIVGMGLMGLGGLVAVTGGILFLVVVLAALLHRDRDPG
jgi:hypothetical protein